MDIQSVPVSSLHTRGVRYAPPEVARGGDSESGPGASGRVVRERGRAALARLGDRAENALREAGNANQRRILSERIGAARESLEARIANALEPFRDRPDSSGRVAGESSGAAGSDAAAGEAARGGDRFDRLRARLAAVMAEGTRAPFRDRSFGTGGTGTGGSDGAVEPSAASVADAVRVGDGEPRGDERELGPTGARLRERASAERNAIMQRLAQALEGAENQNQRRILSQRAGERLDALQERVSGAMARLRGTGGAGDDPAGDPSIGEGRDGDRMLLERIEAARNGLFDRVKSALAGAETDAQHRFLTEAFASAYEDLEARISHALREVGMLTDSGDESGEAKA